MSALKRGGLGRGLNALFEDEETPAFVTPAAALAAQGGNPPEEAPTGNARKVLPVTILRPGQFQPRQVFDDSTLKELSESIAVHGILQPILVRPLKDVFGEFEIICGERRWRAAQKAQLHDVPVTIRELDDEEAMQIALIENLQREDLNPLDEADAYQRLMEEFAHTQENLSQGGGKSRSHIANTGRLLNLPGSGRTYIRQGKLTAGHARALIPAADPESLARQVVEKGLSVRETEKLAGTAELKSGKARKSKEPKDVNTAALEREITDKIGMKVVIDTKIDAKGQQVGSVKIDFSSLDQLEDVIKRLTADRL